MTTSIEEALRSAAEAHADFGQLTLLAEEWKARALAAEAERDERDAEITRLQSDRQYVVGWNDGFDHVHGPLRFPTMLRKMWSGGEVQKWLDEQRIEAARVAHADEGSALQAAEARALAAEAKCDALREALAPFAEAAAAYDPDEGDGANVAWMHDFTIASLRRARALTQETNDGE